MYYSSNKASGGCLLAGCIIGTINLIVVVASLLMFVYGVCVIVSPNSVTNTAYNIGVTHPLAVEYVRAEHMTPVWGVAVSVLALFVFIVSFVGLYGAVTSSRFHLTVYALLLLLLMILQCLLVWYLTGLIIEERDTLDVSTLYTHTLQYAFSCCLYNNHTDIVNGGNYDILPWSCCEAINKVCTVDYSYKLGCHAAITSWYNDNMWYIYIGICGVYTLMCYLALVRRRHLYAVAPVM